MFRVAVLSVGSTDKAANERRTISSGYEQMDTLGIEPRASRMLSGCDTTTPRAQLQHVGIPNLIHAPQVGRDTLLQAVYLRLMQ